MSEVLDKAKDLVDEIYKSMSKVETCETITGEIAGMQVVFVKPGGDRYVKLDGVLSADQQEIVKEFIMKLIDRNKMDAEQFLARLTRKPATINQEFENAVNGMIAEAEVEKVAEVPDTEENVTEEPESVAEPEQKTILEAVDDGEPPAKAYPEMTVEYVKEHYTNVPEASIGSVAEQLGVTKIELRSFLQQNGIPIKSRGGARRRRTLV